MNPIKKKRIRNSIIISVLLIFIIGLIVGIKIEPKEDYNNPAEAVSSVASAEAESKEESTSSENISSLSVSSEEVTVSTSSKESVSSKITSSKSEVLKPTKEEKPYCTIEIRCDTVKDTSKIKNESVRKYIPKDGIILKETKVEISKDETVFEILKRTTRGNKIQFEFRKDPAYNMSAYIEGINHLYEFDAGDASGWMYKVNGIFPNYGCGSYKVKNGDKIVWCYTLNLGKDVGDQYYDK